MMIGLQGAGKTTTAAKIANLLRKEASLRPLLVAADVYRPAAIEQLKVLGKELDIPVYSDEVNQNGANDHHHIGHAYLQFLIDALIHDE